MARFPLLRAGLMVISVNRESIEELDRNIQVRLYEPNQEKQCKTFLHWFFILTIEQRYSNDLEVQIPCCQVCLLSGMSTEWKDMMQDTLTHPGWKCSAAGEAFISVTDSKEAFAYSPWFHQPLWRTQTYTIQQELHTDQRTHHIH